MTSKEYDDRMSELLDASKVIASLPAYTGNPDDWHTLVRARELILEETDRVLTEWQAAYPDTVGATAAPEVA